MFAENPPLQGGICMFSSTVAASTLLIALTNSAQSVPAGYLEMHAVEIKLVEQTNQQRIAHGLSPLKLDNGLMKSARRHTAWMTNTNSFVHTSDPVAENIAYGASNSEHAIDMWMNSPGHRANMLGGYRRIGVAAYVAQDGTTYWCQQFLD